MSIGLDRFNPPPTDVIVPEGDVRGVFKCHYCKADNVGWLWNGSPIDENAYRIKGNITVGSMFSDGTELKNLTVLALPGFDGTPVQCYASLANGSIVYSEPAAHFCVIGLLIIFCTCTYICNFYSPTQNHRARSKTSLLSVFGGLCHCFGNSHLTLHRSPSASV